MYQLTEEGFDNLLEHKRNPIITDCRTARNAGSIIVEDNRVFAYQNNSNGIYGKGLGISEIIDLSLNTFQENE